MGDHLSVSLEAALDAAANVELGVGQLFHFGNSIDHVFVFLRVKGADALVQHFLCFFQAIDDSPQNVLGLHLFAPSSFLFGRTNNCPKGI